ncbi:unnamed protein product [Rhizophagus irregularis]|nr:unnamed protein product [Rhizophagus irregularis]
MNGCLIALNLIKGTEIWRNSLSGMGYNEISLLVVNINSEGEGTSHEAQSSIVIVASHGKLVYKINIYDGKTIWQKKVSTCLLGCSHVTMATHQSSLQNAFTYTGFCNNPIAQHSRKEKENNKYEIAYGTNII